MLGNYLKSMMREQHFSHQVVTAVIHPKVISGCGVASTGLALNASTSIDDYKTYYSLLKTMNPVGNTFSMADSFIGSNILTRIGTDLLSSSIWLNAETKQRWFN